MAAGEDERLRRFYEVKRAFLFADEHLFYMWLYVLLHARQYVSLGLIAAYGGACIYTAYRNLGAIERRLFPALRQWTLWPFIGDGSGVVPAPPHPPRGEDERHCVGHR